MADEPRKIAFICSKGNLDMAYPALIMGWAALGNGIEVTIFFTFWGMDLINKARIDHLLEVPPVANFSMKMNLMGVPGTWVFLNSWAPSPACRTHLMHKEEWHSQVPPVCANICRCLLMLVPSVYAASSVDTTALIFIDGVDSIVTAGHFLPICLKVRRLSLSNRMFD